MFALLGQGLLALLAGATRSTNPVYRFFLVLTRPALALLRLVTPKAINDRHFPVVAFFLLFWLWLLLAYAKRMVGEAG